jgi:cobalt-zinc-cadmium efflux system outer membrane protein
MPFHLQRYGLSFSVAALLCIPVVAQPEGAPPLTVDQAVALAIKQNPRLSAAAGEVAAAQAGVRSAGALANPALTVAPGITSIGGTGEELLLQQPLEINGARGARARVARAHLRGIHARAVVELRTLVFETKSAYYELARTQGLQSLARDALQTAEEFDRITRRQVEIGARPGIDQTQTGIEVIRARQQVTLAESRVTTAQAALNTLMGRPPAEPVGQLPPLALAAVPAESEVALRQALATRAEITAAEAAQETFREEARLARVQGRPDLVPQFRAGSITRGLRDSGLGLGVTLPLFDYGSRRDRIRQAEAAARAQEGRIEATRRQVRQEVEQALARLRAAETVIRDYQSGVLDQARRLLEASRTGFQGGLTSVVALVEAQRTYRSVLTEYTNALVDHALARAELERATGAVSPDQAPILSSVPRNSK